MLRPADATVCWPSLAGQTAPREPLVIIAVGQWIPRKNLATLVRAWGKAAVNGWQLALIGETEADPTYAAEVWQAVRNCPAPVTGARHAQR
ncbi:MAG: hypothetical protein KatS3mg055_2949 [Chloroflexus sp.]|uniref:hypothetical protein n=1 Tax=Chloroflexus sp. TaxID=1904827 RepID=UPI0021DC310E|nr:hypothetical protein [Chloroflexus sp.]GIV90431.1 MAG: hypothetical protein KatS3mg055_2949 [Chloroflexus sp.]